VNYTTKQINTKVGFISSTTWWRISPIFKISREYYNDTQIGENGGISIIDQEFNFKERRWMLDTGFGYKLSKSVFITFRYQSQLRTTNDDLLLLHQSREIHNLVRNWGQFYVDTKRRLDNRVSLQITLQPHQKVRVQIFGAFDLDADTNRYTDRIQRFDKGGAKMIIALD
ncbi:MAG TPA: hypothetical protein VJ941_09560, partial [Gracilimonas sp.]|nr:hypothetical protein [Gracilimonas sp.]